MTTYDSVLRGLAREIAFSIGADAEAEVPIEAALRARLKPVLEAAEQAEELLTKLGFWGDAEKLRSALADLRGTEEG